jgi:tRNA(fMet)-specific endonuclease VapC
MLDTNVLSHLVREPLGIAAKRLTARGIDRSCTSILSAAELRFGAVRSQSEGLRDRVDVILAGIAILPLEQPVEQVYADTRAHLERQGKPIGPTDLFIAAHALTLDLTLITANIREFSRVPDLRVENWLD